jgi:hypothetical protein
MVVLFVHLNTEWDVLGPFTFSAKALVQVVVLIITFGAVLGDRVELEAPVHITQFKAQIIF